MQSICFTIHTIRSCIFATQSIYSMNSDIVEYRVNQRVALHNYNIVEYRLNQRATPLNIVEYRLNR